jgi:GntR family transcriptional regulator / MocR family aminotransferase
VSGALIIRDVGGAARGRGPAFLPADLRPEPAGGLYQSLYKRLRGFILDGVWPPGTRLPSSRALAADLKVSRNTAILAVEQLVADGWAESRSRSGVYVSAAPVAPPAPPRAVERSAPAELPVFALQRPATDLFPAQIWKQLQARAWAQIEPQHLLTADPAGDPGLREAIVRLVCAPRGLRAHPDQVLVLPSATMAVDLIAAALLRPGDPAVIEAPGRPALRQLLRTRGTRLCPVPVDADGLDTAALPAHARLACVAPAVQFPTGAALSPDRRAFLADWARSGGAWLVEDDRDSECAAGDAAPLPLAAEAPDRTLFVASFNRQLFPGLCVAFLVAPPGLVDRLRAAHVAMGGRASLASQLALRAFIAEGHYARHLRKRRQAYAERRALLAALLGVVDPGAGLHLSLPVAPGTAAELARRLAEARLGGVDLAQLTDGAPAADRILLGLGAAPAQLHDHAPRIAAILEGAR